MHQNQEPLNSRPQIKLEYGEHKQQAVVFAGFMYNREIIDRLKQSTPARWSVTKKRWYIPRNKFELNTFFVNLKDLAFIDYSALKNKPAENTDLQNRTPEKPPTNKNITLPKGYMERLEQERYSENTIKIYTRYFKDFVAEFSKKNLKEITREEINEYILRIIKERNISHSQQNQRINAIKYYYEKVLRHDKEFYQIDRPRKESKLPDVLSKKEIAAMIKSTENKKHKCLIAFIYSCGLRRSEAINLKIEDIDSGRMKIKIRGAKGKKDRYVDLPTSLLPVLREYYKEYSPKNWLFEGQKGKKYSPTSVLRTIKKSARLAGIKKRVYPHILRHSYATHFLEQGIDIRYIQEWMGHETIKTTEQYTHVAQTNKNFKNPLDDII